VNPTASGAFTLGGSVSGSAACGWGALSNSSTAMKKNGNSAAQAGWLVSTGGIDSGFASNGTVKPNTGGLSDPYAAVATPSPAGSPSRSYSCPIASAGSPGTTTTTATVTTRTLVQDILYSGTKNNAQTTVVSTTTISDTTPAPAAGQTVPNGSVNGNQLPYPSQATATGSLTSTGSGNNKTYYRTDRVTSIYRTYASVTPITSGATPATDGIARPQPGTYTTINIACETRFAPGIYLVDDIDFGQNQVVTGTDVMFVIKQAGGMHINSNSNIALSGISPATLTGTYGYSGEAAAKLGGLIIFDRLSTAQFKLNGNADLKIDGTVYMPNREVWFNGNSTASGVCMAIVAGQITFTGNNSLSNFCTPTTASPLPVGGGEATVKLVA
jgi:hypothetical protein